MKGPFPRIIECLQDDNMFSTLRERESRRRLDEFVRIKLEVNLRAIESEVEERYLHLCDCRSIISSLENSRHDMQSERERDSYLSRLTKAMKLEVIR